MTLHTKPGMGILSYGCHLSIILRRLVPITLGLHTRETRSICVIYRHVFFIMNQNLIKQFERHHLATQTNITIQIRVEILKFLLLRTDKN